MIKERLRRLRECMKKAGVTVYVIPSSDCHESEYVCAHFRAREYMTGFSGSAGTAVITEEEAGLWTDGRYFVQAQMELAGTSVRLFKMEEPGVPDVETYVKEHLKAGGKLGFDGRTMSAFKAEKLKAAAEEKGAALLVTENLVGAVWDDRPQLPKSRAFILEEQWSGESTGNKLERVRKQMAEQGADIHVLASLCDIAWILNIRGRDIPHVPVVLSFLSVTKDTCTWYVDGSALSDRVQRHLKENGIKVKGYEEIYTDLRGVKDGQKVWLDKKSVNYRLLYAVPEKARILNQSNPSELMKAVKNPTEIQNLKAAHLKESLAFTRFMYWLKSNVHKEEITEISAAAYLDHLREEQGNYLEQSFAPICAYGSHGAIVHYSATEESNTRILPEGFLLVDAGGHYREGTTDTTRTFALGALTEEQKRMYTAVCRGNLKLASARFLYGCTGYNLDILCREPLWQLGMDYKHGTGHGVGHLLNVHEGPNAFRWKLKDGGTPAALEPGMVTTDEPGIYIKDRYGIRLENELLCVKQEENKYGQFLGFEVLTLVPFDLDAILPQEMTQAEREYLNRYHQTVYDALAPHLNEEERAWLKDYTRKI
ncbi:MAG TPA: peptidase M24 [Lachnospiraceae bacterium]|nr:peptidase M24 [Lachnospiraceae bacterium]